MKDSASDAKHYALRLIRYRDRSEKEMSERLSRKGFSEKTVSDTITILKRSGFINDHILADSLEEIARNVKLLGNRGIEFFLKKRGISDSIISAISVPESDELERALKLISKKKKSLSRHPVKTRIGKIRGILFRRGYSFETISAVTRTLRKDEE